MVNTFAPSTGVRFTNHSALALPSDWGQLWAIFAQEADEQIANYEKI
jgi:hypothetical protein